MNGTIKRLKSLYHKKGVNPDDWDHVHPDLIAVAAYVLQHCDTYALPMVITSIVRPKIQGISRTDVHASGGVWIGKNGTKYPYKGRAFDMSILGWSIDDVKFLRDEVNRIFGVGAFSIKDLREREAVYEDGKSEGTAPHLHFQVRH